MSESVVIGHGVRGMSDCPSVRLMYVQTQQEFVQQMSFHYTQRTTLLPMGRVQVIEKLVWKNTPSKYIYSTYTCTKKQTDRTLIAHLQPWWQ